MKIPAMECRCIESLMLKVAKEHVDEDDFHIQCNYDSVSQHYVFVMTVMPQSGTEPFIVTDRFTSSDVEKIKSEDGKMVVVDLMKRLERSLINGIDLHRYQRASKPQFAHPAYPDNSDLKDRHSVHLPPEQ